MTPCENCDGKGGFDYTGTVWLDHSGHYADGWVECPACGGTGWVCGEPQQLTEDDLIERSAPR